MRKIVLFVAVHADYSCTCTMAQLTLSIESSYPTKYYNLEC